jgi:ABC-2 type transport system ATP-binding protein
VSSSLAYRPRLLVLDEPFSGLDPVVRDELVRGVLELAGEERWSVLISSHDLDEVERLVDAVGFIDAGRLVLMEPLADLHERFRRVEVTTAEPARDAPPMLPHWTACRRRDASCGLSRRATGRQSRSARWRPRFLERRSTHSR